MMYISQMPRKTVPWQDHVIPEPNSGCLLWEGWFKGNGYAGIQRDGKSVYVHRLVWEEAHGPIPDGMHVLHRCDVRLCVNIDHLFLGTRLDNMQDMAAKGRGNNEAHGYRRLWDECSSGHPFTEENTRYYKAWRYCRECQRNRDRGRSR
jgi:hypothetical protein